MAGELSRRQTQSRFHPADPRHQFPEDFRDLSELLAFLNEHMRRFNQGPHHWCEYLHIAESALKYARDWLNRHHPSADGWPSPYRDSVRRKTADHVNRGFRRLIKFAEKLKKSSGKRSAKPKQSTARRDTRDVIIAALNHRHNYGRDSGLNLNPVGVSELANILKPLAKSTVSRFFKREFGGYANYEIACRDLSKLENALILLNGDARPRALFQNAAVDEIGPSSGNRRRGKSAERPD
jgi:hypothetical protein